MTDLGKVIKGLECCAAMSGDECRECPYGHECWDTNLPYGMSHLAADALSLLKEQEVRELTIDEWREWKANPKRNPICKLWENDTSPMWILNPNDVHEPAFLMGKLKLFTGKPTFEQCKAVKWE